MAQGAGKYLSKAGIPWAIASSGKIESAGLGLKVLGVDPRKAVVVTRDQVRYAKPDPDLVRMFRSSKPLGYWNSDLPATSRIRSARHYFGGLRLLARNTRWQGAAR